MRPYSRSTLRGRMAWVMRKVAAVAALYVIAVIVAVGVGRFVDPPVTALMLIRLVQGEGIDYRPVGLGAISAELPQAVLTSEDNHFCTHLGVDWGAVGEVLEDFRDGEETRGASTVTMQLAKNLFLWPSRSYVRKGLEIPLAYLVDFAWPKRRIIEVYLNIAEWAPGVYGAEAAARHHFGKSAKDLARREAALLAAALPAPTMRQAGKPGPRTRSTASRIVRRMRNTRELFGCIDG